MSKKQTDRETEKGTFDQITAIHRSINQIINQIISEIVD
jgi:hypothetical protein